MNSIRRLREWWQLPPLGKWAVRRDRDSDFSGDPGISSSVASAIAWICVAQDYSSTADGGIARHYSVVSGWGPSYPETAGYIVPTIIAYANATKNADLLTRGRTILDWLVSIQLEGGGFQGGTVTDTPVVPVVFNTGQILLGLAAGSTEFGEPFTSAMHRAAKWLVSIQDPDGSWRKHHSPFARAGDKAYDTHTAWGLLEAARTSEDSGYADAALRNIRWAVSKQRPNGWFEDCCLSKPDQPLTHTIGYTLKGIIEGYLYSDDSDLLHAARRTADGLLKTVRSDGFIAGRLDEHWNATVPWVCLTGSVQISQSWLQLFQKTGYRPYLDAACAANAYVRRTVEIDGPAEMRGAIRGSFPINGEYGKYQYLNWAAKFFIDSNLLEKEIREQL